ncbi:hypothetical protein IG631_24315, partial [Alternaria alternata]
CEASTTSLTSVDALRACGGADRPESAIPSSALASSRTLSATSSSTLRSSVRWPAMASEIAFLDDTPSTRV